MLALGHLRAVKDPLLLRSAMELLPERVRLHATHLGGVLDEALAEEARRASAPRWQWLGERTRCNALRRLARARALVLTSRSEGGPSVIAEAALLGRPILATRTGGAVGMLGADHPGLYDVGDARALAALLERLADDPVFLAETSARSRSAAARFDPRLEAEAWEGLLSEPLDN